MFKIITSGRNIALTEAIKTYVQEKFERLDQHFDFIKEIHVFLGVEKNPSISNNQLAEATVHVSGAVVRLETASGDLYVSIDQLVDKVDRSLTKHKTKLLHRSKSSHGESIRRTELPPSAASDNTPNPSDDEDLGEFFYVDDEAEPLTTSEKVTM